MPTGDPYEDFHAAPMTVAEDSTAYQFGSVSSGNDALNYDKDYSFRGRSQGEFTIDDLMCTPEGMRFELIDGRIYDMGSPTTIHQIIVTRIANQISNGIEKLQGSCIPLVSPVGVKLFPDDDKNFLEPDISIVCDRHKIQRDMLAGAPDLVIEVLSPSSRRRDMFLKMLKYQQAGVREYWIIDPDNRRVTVHHFESLLPTDSYTFEDLIPVEISKEKIVIDLGRINHELTDLFGEDH